MKTVKQWNNKAMKHKNMKTVKQWNNVTMEQWNIFKQNFV